MDKKKVTVGILAHVDAGKTTLIESMLYQSHQIRTLGRVDHQDAFLDFDHQERQRGITIFSKEAHLEWKDTDIYVIDTPGHIDFSAEMERSLQVLDLAILLINGQDGVQSHTKTIWKCLEHYHIPTLVFVNKMDISYHSKEELLKDLPSTCIDFTEDYLEKVALCNEDCLNAYIETQNIPTSLLQQAIYRRECFPCFFGSALKQEGIQPLMDAIVQYSLDKDYPSDFGALVYKISTNEKGQRLTHVKITGGTCKVKQKINEEEKIDQIRIYNGQGYESVQEVSAGTICVFTGLSQFEVGQGIGNQADSIVPTLEAYMNYELVLPSGVDPLSLKDVCEQLSQEDPQLHMVYDEKLKKITLRLMGPIQMEVLSNRIYEKTHIQVGFSNGDVLFKETIQESVIGKGHFEPLRHYAEVHLRLEPLPRNSGMIYESEVSTNELPQNWQHLILTHLEEREHRGVLTGSPITDMKITLIAGKGSIKHTMGGDFRQATYRAIRQGLMQATNLLLEPYYNFTIHVPQSSLSRVLYDLEQRHAKVEVQEDTITGKGPVRTLSNYQNELTALSKGLGTFVCQPAGYDICEDAETIIAQKPYNPEKDMRNPTGSVFCTHGAGFYVPWNEVDTYMHIQPKNENSQSYRSIKYTISDEEAKRVFAMTNGQNKNKDKHKVKPKKKKIDLEKVETKPLVQKPECLVVDGYNQIFGWQSLKGIPFDSARDELIDRLSNYQGYRNCYLIIVFDAYRVKDSTHRSYKKGDLEVIFTKYDETADSYIEKHVSEWKKKYRLIVASSDGLIQNTILAHGCQRMSARELEKRALSTNADAFKTFHTL